MRPEEPVGVPVKADPPALIAETGERRQSDEMLGLVLPLLVSDVDQASC